MKSDLDEKCRVSVASEASATGCTRPSA